MEKLFKFTAGAVVGLGAVVGVATSAGAESASTGYITRYANSYASPSSYTGIVHKGLQPGTPIDTICAREGAEIDGNKMWFIVSKDGEVGYVHRSDISAPVETPYC